MGVLGQGGQGDAEGLVVVLLGVLVVLEEDFEGDLQGLGWELAVLYLQQH